MSRTSCAAGVVVVAAIALFGARAAWAEPGMSLGLNEAVRVSLAGTVASVVVANPKIADANVVDAHSVIVIGKSYGSAQIMALDANGRLLFDRLVVVSVPNAGLITLYRGSKPQQFNCLATCESRTPNGSTGNFFEDLLNRNSDN